MSDSVIQWTVAHQAALSMGILQARILQWVAMSSSRGSPQPWDFISTSTNKPVSFLICAYSRRKTIFIDITLGATHA